MLYFCSISAFWKLTTIFLSLVRIVSTRHLNALTVLLVHNLYCGNIEVNKLFLSLNLWCLHFMHLQKLTGGTLLSRNKEYIVIYRGNDFLPPAVTKTLTERQKLTVLQQDEEEKARQNASSITLSNSKSSQMPLLAGTLAETRAATANWGHQPSKQVGKMMRESILDRLSSLIRNHESKLALVSYKRPTEITSQRLSVVTISI